MPITTDYIRRCSNLTMLFLLREKLTNELCYKGYTPEITRELKYLLVVLNIRVGELLK